MTKTRVMVMKPAGSFCVHTLLCVGTKRQVGRQVPARVLITNMIMKYDSLHQGQEYEQQVQKASQLVQQIPNTIRAEMVADLW